MVSAPYNQVFSALAERFGVRDRAITAFEARISHIQRFKKIGGINTGKGKRAEYGAEQVSQLCIILTLVDVGITPAVAADMSVALMRHVDNRPLDAIPNKVVVSPNSLTGGATCITSLLTPDVSGVLINLREIVEWARKVTV